MNKIFIKRSLQLAMEIALYSDHRCKIGCVVTDKRGKIISQGFNRLKTHPTQAHYAKRYGNIHQIYLHAEISALIKCREAPHTIFIARHLRSGKEGIGKPCPICEMAIKESGVKNVIYTNGSEITYKNN